MLKLCIKRLKWTLGTMTVASDWFSSSWLRSWILKCHGDSGGGHGDRDGDQEDQDHHEASCSGECYKIRKLKEGKVKQLYFRILFKAIFFLKLLKNIFGLYLFGSTVSIGLFNRCWWIHSDLFVFVIIVFVFVKIKSSTFRSKAMGQPGSWLCGFGGGGVGWFFERAGFVKGFFLE